jgi:hypothetical protein
VVVHLPPPVPLHRDVRHLLSSLGSIDGVAGRRWVGEVASRAGSSPEIYRRAGRRVATRIFRRARVGACMGMKSARMAGCVVVRVSARVVHLMGEAFGAALPVPVTGERTDGSRLRGACGLWAGCSFSSARSKNLAGFTAPLHQAQGEITVFPCQRLPQLNSKEMKSGLF